MELSKSNINFGAKILDAGMIKKATNNGYHLVKSNFAELSTKSQKDLDFIEDLFFHHWSMTNTPDKCIANIKIDFVNDARSGTKPLYKYFVTRLTSGKGTLPQRTCAVSSVKVNNDVLEIKNLQSASSIITPGVTVPKVKGAGELNIAGIVKLAKEHGFKRIELVSMVDSFYEKMGFSKIERNRPNRLDDTTHCLDANMFEAFINKITSKYKSN